MKYHDLIQFEPLDDVIQLRSADERSKAEKLVATYVISDRMADVLMHRILPSLRIDKVEQSGGLFIVGNYGTGKSHLMSVVSAVAEHGDLLEKLTHPAVASGLVPIAGKFKVIRQEFGGTEMTLRDVVFSYVERGLSQMGVTHSFPRMDEAPNSKDCIAEMMAAFHDKYPDHGLLIVVDELLDYLRARKDQPLVLDLAFLREVGEICGQMRLRFIAGLQESLFDSPRFEYVADSIRRVKDRFEQVRIVREDVAYVVSRRLLAKTQAQRGQIRQHLQRFTTLYESLAERLDDYVELFPVHPAYLEMFELVTVIEKRQVLKALSREMNSRLGKDVPGDGPGLISFDSYWEMIKEDASYNTIPEISKVLKCSNVLEDRIISALPMEAYKAPALRIVQALALHRLTVGDIKAPVGLTAKELRDRLCLSIPIPEMEAGFLLTTVEAVLTEITRVMNGQFISYNRANGQYYLDLEKTRDYDAEIEKRMASLDNNELNRYYFDMLTRALELTDSVYVPGFRIWQRELPWLGQGITRQGYVFLGAPNERSTAQPPRDFYVHFLAPYPENGKPKEDKAAREDQPDEVFFTLAHRDTAFDDVHRRYAAARELSQGNSGEAKTTFEKKADEFLRSMNAWLRDNLTRAFEIRARGEAFTPVEALSRYRLSLRDATLRDAIFHLAAACLGEHFAGRYPDYPRFGAIEFTKDTIAQGADAALRAIAGGPITRPAQSVLEALGIGRVDGSQLIYELDASPYAAHFMGQLEAQPEGKVLNRSALLQGALGVEKDVRFGLEPEWLVVVLLALVRQKSISLQLPLRKIDSDDLAEASRMGVAELVKFTSVGRPKALPTDALKALFAGLGLPESWVDDASKHEFAVQQLQAVVLRELDTSARTLETLREGLRYWREQIHSSAEAQEWRDQLTTYKAFLDSLQHLTTPGRLRNFTTGVGEVRAKLKGRSLLAQVMALNELLQSMQSGLDYIYQAEVNLPGDHPWQAEAASLCESHLRVLRDPARRSGAGLRALLSGGLANLRSSYAQTYIALHNHARLNSAEDGRKKRLVSDRRWAHLRGLAALDFFFAVGDLQRLEREVSDLRSCPGVGAADLKEHTLCALCSYSPRDQGQEKTALARLESAEARFETLYEQWIAALRADLASETAQANIAMLPSQDREAVEAFVRSGELPERISEHFINALRDALRGLEKVVIDGPDFLRALTQPGMPCTPEEFEGRFRRFLAEQVRGKDPQKVRIQVDW
ncbi:MAG: hypothetical protein JXB15_13620 [Anaerolineales bacterium]|nr:hypothetical protein [Anaerolineales bacterium]